LKTTVTNGGFKLTGVSANDSISSWDVFNSWLYGKASLTEGDNTLTKGYGSDLTMPVNGNVTLTISNVTESSCKLNIALTQEVPVTHSYYLIGEFNGWSEDTRVPFVDNDTAYTLTKTFSGAFKIMDGSDWLGGNGGGKDYELKADWPSVELVSGDNLYIAGNAAEYTLTIKNGILTVTGWQEEQPDEITSVVIKGSTDENWTTTTTLPLIKDATGKWTLANQAIEEGFEFKVVAIGSVSGEHWLGAASDGDFWVTKDILNNPIGLTEGENLYFDQAGTFTFTVADDLSTLTITGEFDEPIVLEPALYMLGSFNEWKDSTMVAMTKAADGKFTYTMNNVTEGMEFKFKDENGDWIGSNATGESFWLNIGTPTAELVKPGKNFYIDGTGNLTFTVDSARTTLTVTGFDVPVVENKLYLIGSFNEWRDSTRVEMTLGAHGKFTVTQAMEANAEFKLKDQDGNWIGAVSEGNFIVTKEQVENGTELSLLSGDAGKNFQIPVAGTWTFTADKDSMKLVISGQWEEQPQVLIGDVNGDGIINVSDVTTLINAIMAPEIPAGFNVKAGDVNEDGILTVGDVTALIPLIMN
ncbi:MAG: hypothetical protein IK092_05975, partial [Muribaculaceae bacterium]|nr:hypothetical protein [Muribaculaceae bacterium]